jgi:2,3-dihydro-2,3-dihydroxybenzoate dehydrogenase
MAAGFSRPNRVGDRRGQGIGYATALAFVEAGAQVTGFDLAFDGESYPFATETLDVADAQQVAQVCGRLLATSSGWTCW